MAWKYNPFLGTKTKLDAVQGLSVLDGRYLKLDCSNDPLTEQLVINLTTPGVGDCGQTALKVNGDICIKAGNRLIMDGS
jgi:hypothetical protein